MSTTSSNLTSTAAALPSDGVLIPYITRFWLFLVSNILSLLCCLFVLFHLLVDRALRHGLHYHVVIVVLVLCAIWELTTVPWTMYLYLYSVVWIRSPEFCMIWKFIDTIIYTTIAKLVAWTALERHILIFHHRWLASSKQRFLFHYTPIALILIYGIALYGVTIFINDCGRKFYYVVLFCGYSGCVNNYNSFSLYEFISGGVASSLCIGLGSLALIIRVVGQKRRLKREMQWRKHRKLLIQLLSVTSLFFILYLPPVLLAMARRLGVPAYVGADYSRYAVFFSYYIVFLLPFASAVTLPDLRSRLAKLVSCFGRRQRRIVIPQGTFAKQMMVAQRPKDAASPPPC